MEYSFLFHFIGAKLQKLTKTYESYSRKYSGTFFRTRYTCREGRLNLIINFNCDADAIGLVFAAADSFGTYVV